MEKKGNFGALRANINLAVFMGSLLRLRCPSQRFISQLYIYIYVCRRSIGFFSKRCTIEAQRLVTRLFTMLLRDL